MQRCPGHNCGFTYDPAKGVKRGKERIPPGIEFEELPEEWKCPCCGAKKEVFKKIED